MCVLERLLQQLLPCKHRILIFSQMTTTLDILQGYLTSQKINCYRLDGSTSREEREANIAAFADPLDTDRVPVYLLSTRAGGVGINLQAADTVIFFDSDWNPQVDMQAMSRAHRLGQTETVLVLRLVTCGYPAGVLSAEQRILRTAAHKLVAEQVVLAEGQFDMGTSTVSGRATSSQHLGGIEPSAVEIDDASDPAAAIPLLDKEQGVLSLFAVDEEKCSHGAAALANVVAAVAAKSGKAASPFGTPVLLGAEALDAVYLSSMCSRGESDGLLSAEVSSLPSSAMDVDPLEGSSAAAANAAPSPAFTPTEPLSMQAFHEALDWAPWLGMPPGFEDRLRDELSKLKRENRLKLEKLRAHDEEVRRKADAEKRAAEQERLDAEQAILDAKAGAAAAITARRNEMAKKKADREAARETAATAKAAAAAAKVAAKLAKSAEKQKQGITTPVSADNSPSRSTRVRSLNRKLLDEDSLWGDAVEAAEAEAAANNRDVPEASARVLKRESGGSGEKRPVGRPRKTPPLPGHTPKAVRKSPQRTAALADSTQDNDVCVLCGDLQAPAATAFDLPGDDESLSAKEREKLMLLCECCDGAFHMNCLGLREVPLGEWQCRMCSGPAPRLLEEPMSRPSAVAVAVALESVDAVDAATAASPARRTERPQRAASPRSSSTKRSLQEPDAAVTGTGNEGAAPAAAGTERSLKRSRLGIEDEHED